MGATRVATGVSIQQHCAQSLEPHVSPAPKNTKWSCATFITLGRDVIGQMSQCELLIEGAIFPQVVAIGKFYQEATTLHNVPLSLDVVKVMVEKVRVVDARVPLPSDGVTIVADAFHTFIAWPRHLIRIIPKSLVIISFHYINLYLYITSNLIQMFFNL